jgi:hypothetical protein
MPPPREPRPQASIIAATSGTIIFVGTAGETRTISVQINGDLTVELNETFAVLLRQRRADGRAVAIADAEPPAPS